MGLFYEDIIWNGFRLICLVWIIKHLFPKKRELGRQHNRKINVWALHFGNFLEYIFMNSPCQPPENHLIYKFRPTWNPANSKIIILSNQSTLHLPDSHFFSLDIALEYFRAFRTKLKLKWDFIDIGQRTDILKDLWYHEICELLNYNSKIISFCAQLFVRFFRFANSPFLSQFTMMEKVLAIG